MAVPDPDRQRIATRGGRERRRRRSGRRLGQGVQNHSRSLTWRNITYSTVECGLSPPSPSNSVSCYKMPARNAKDLWRIASRLRSPGAPSHTCLLYRTLHGSGQTSATPLPIAVVGPPPSPPLPKQSQKYDRIEKTRKQAEMLQQAKKMRATQNQSGKRDPPKKRFWKDVHVKKGPGPPYNFQLVSILPTDPSQMATRSSSTPAQSAQPTSPSLPSLSPNPISPMPSL
jgi:hypothetical protein